LVGNLLLVGRKMKKPSTRIRELAEKYRLKGIDPGFSNCPDPADWLNAIVDYLDEEYKKEVHQKAG